MMKLPLPLYGLKCILKGIITHRVSLKRVIYQQKWISYVRIIMRTLLDQNSLTSVLLQLLNQTSLHFRDRCLKMMSMNINCSITQTFQEVSGMIWSWGGPKYDMSPPMTHYFSIPTSNLYFRILKDYGYALHKLRKFMSLLLNPHSDIHKPLTTFENVWFLLVSFFSNPYSLPRDHVYVVSSLQSAKWPLDIGTRILLNNKMRMEQRLANDRDATEKF